MLKKLSAFWTRFGFYVSLIGALALIAGAAIGYRAQPPSASAQLRASSTPLAAAAMSVATPAPAKSFDVALPLAGAWLMPHSPDQAIYDSALNAYTAHCGIDIAASPGDTVFAAAEGKISALYKSGEYGYTLEIEHAGGYLTRYGGLSPDSALSIGQRVYQGAAVASIGDYPCSESHLGTHLHFEITLDGVCLDPTLFLPSVL